MSIRLAFAGFRHGHIFDLYHRAIDSEEIEVVAACESDQNTREQILRQGTIHITHDNINEMLEIVDCDAVAIGEYYSRRGSLIMQALSHGKHVVCDKPICTSLEELDEIKVISTENDRKVVCMLDMRDSPQFISVRKLILEGTIGEIHAISFNGQHPLLLGTRPGWYFEPGKHGGTINDIAVHAIDAIPWMTGLRFKRVNAARCWNAFANDFLHFEDAGQMMLTMDNGCGVLGDVSYMAPDSSGYTLPFYWRMTFWGRLGIIETSKTSSEVAIALNGEQGIRYVPLSAGNPGGYLQSFIHDIKGNLGQDELGTEYSLRAARNALTIQKAADTHMYDLPLE